MPDDGPHPLWDKGITKWQPAQSRMAPQGQPRSVSALCGGAETPAMYTIQMGSANGKPCRATIKLPGRRLASLSLPGATGDPGGRPALRQDLLPGGPTGSRWAKRKGEAGWTATTKPTAPPASWCLSIPSPATSSSGSGRPRLHAALKPRPIAGVNPLFGLHLCPPPTERRFPSAALGMVPPRPYPQTMDLVEKARIGL